MSQISPINEPVVPTRAVRNQNQAGFGVTSSTDSAQGQDKVEISSVAQSLSNMASASNIRLDKVAQVRAAIGRGEYLTDDKIEQTLDKLLQVLR